VDATGGPSEVSKEIIGVIFSYKPDAINDTHPTAALKAFRFNWMPYVKLRIVYTDKRALYVVSTSDIGPQIYELVTSSKDERNK